MPSERFMVDANTRAGGAIGGYSSADAIGTDNPTLIVARFDPTTGRMLVDVNGADLISDGDAVSASNDGYLVLGTDGSNYQVLATDSSGHLQVDVLSGGGGGTQYLEDDAHTTGDTGTMILAVRRDSASSLADADGDYIPLTTNASGKLWTITDAVQSGAWTVALGATERGYIDGLEGLLTTIAGAVLGTEMQVDVLTMPTTTVQATDLDIRDLTSVSDSVSAVQSGTWNITNISGTVSLPTGASTSAKQDTIIGHVDGIEGLLTTIDADTSVLAGTDFMLGTDFSNVLGTASLILATQADDVANTSDGLQTSSFMYVFDGTTWDRLRGDATNGMLVNLGSNNDVTVTGTVDLGAIDNAVLDAIAASVAAIDTDATTIIGHVDGLEALIGTTNTNTGAATTALQIMDDWDNGASDGASVSGDVAHDTADAGEPVKMGLKAVALKANPTEVAANDRTNWYADVSGIPFVLPGHMNTLTQSLQVTDADGAQTDTAIITAGANVAIVVTKVSVMADGANSGDVSVRIGFGTANTPAVDAAQMLLFHPGIKAGSGVVEGTGGGILGIGASGEDVRVTCEDPAGGSINIIVTYFTTDI